MVEVLAKKLTCTAKSLKQQQQQSNNDKKTNKYDIFNVD